MPQGAKKLWEPEHALKISIGQIAMPKVGSGGIAQGLLGLLNVNVNVNRRFL